MCALLQNKLFLLILIMALSGSITACTGFFFYPEEPHRLTPDNIDLRYNDIFIESKSGHKLHAWLLPAKTAAKGTVIFLHGNAENISTHIQSVYWLPEQGFNVFLMDYSGFGKSEGTPTIMGVMQDVEAGLENLLARKDIDPDKVIVFGQSLGGAISVYVVANTAYRKHIKALVIESAFADYHQIGKDVLANSWLTWPLSLPIPLVINNQYSPLRFIDKISPIPVLIIHSLNDEVVPYSHAEQLYNVAKEPKQLWPITNGGHIYATRDPAFRAHLLSYMENIVSQEVK